MRDFFEDLKDMFEDILDKISRWIRNPDNKIYLILICATILAWIIFPLIPKMEDYREQASIIYELPYNDIEIDGNKIRMLSVSNGSHESKSGYGYVPVVKVEFDFAEISQKERYWMGKDESFQLDCCVSSAGNYLADYQMDIVEPSLIGDKLTVVFTCDEDAEWKHSFDDMAVLLKIRTLNEELMSYRDTVIHKENVYVYYGKTVASESSSNVDNETPS